MSKYSSEIWRPIPGLEGYYEASSLGQIRSLRCSTGTRKTPRVSTQTLDRDGYYQVSISSPSRRTKLSVSRLVCKAFYGMPESDLLDCCHIDGDKTNNLPTNLMWGTRKENNLHKNSHGTMPRGASVFGAKLTEREVLLIRKEKEEQKTSNVQLGKKYGISDRAVGKIIRGESWTHL